LLAEELGGTQSLERDVLTGPEMIALGETARPSSAFIVLTHDQVRIQVSVQGLSRCSLRDFVFMQELHDCEELM
jgi:hypothetical protein